MQKQDIEMYLAELGRTLQDLGVQQPVRILSEPWFDSPSAHKPQVRTRIIEQTPEPEAQHFLWQPHV